VVDHLEIQQILKIELSALEGELEFEAWTVDIWILHPTSFPQCFFELRVPSSHDEHSFPILESVLFLPLVQVGHVGVAAHLPHLLLH
jgi:hypothetical protein